MAHREDIMDRILQKDPVHYELISKLIELFKDDVDNIIILDGESTREEQKMVLVEAYMNSGMEFKEAEQVAEAKLSLLDEIFEKGKIAVN